MRRHMKSYIHLIRHGVTEANKKMLYYGHADIPLAEEGIEIIKTLVCEGIYPRPENASYYTSGLTRAEQTLDLIYGGVPRVKLDALKEMFFGDYELKAHAELKGGPFYEIWRKDKSGMLSPPGGESARDFIARVKNAFNEIIDSHCRKDFSGSEKNSVVVCHAGVIGAIMMSYFDDRPDDLFKWVPVPGHGYTLNLEGKLPVSYIAF